VYLILAYRKAKQDVIMKQKYYCVRFGDGGKRRVLLDGKSEFRVFHRSRPLPPPPPPLLVLCPSRNVAGKETRPEKMMTVRPRASSGSYTCPTPRLAPSLSTSRRGCRPPSCLRAPSRWGLKKDACVDAWAGWGGGVASSSLSAIFFAA